MSLPDHPDCPTAAIARSTVGWDVLWILGWFILSSVWCLTASTRLGAVFDEPIYIARGLERWTSGECKGLMRLGTMPLPVDVQTLPLYLYERSRGQALDPDLDLARVLPWARAMTLVFWCTLLIYAFLAARSLGGVWAGRLAVALIASEPSFLAQATLATTDVAVTACLLALAYHFWDGCGRGWIRRRALPAIWFGLALLAKASSLVYGPLILLIIEAARLSRGEVSWNAFRGMRARDVAWIAAGGLATAFVYCGSDWRPEPTFVRWADRLPEGASRDWMLWLSEHLRIFSNAGEGLVQQVKHNVRGHGTYLLGRVWPRACWYYFWVVPTIKLSVSLLLLPLVLLVVRPRSLMNVALITAAVLLGLGPMYRVQLGIRIILPLVALGIVGLAAAAATAWRQCEARWRQRLVFASAFMGVCWAGASSVTVWPEALCYCNELWGGTEQGYRYVSETNYDWGQGLKQLEEWVNQHQVHRIDIWYYGTDTACKRPPFREVGFHQLPLKCPDDLLPHVQGHVVAVGLTHLYGSLGQDDEAYQHAVAFFRARNPAARTSTFIIYDFSFATSSPN
jgi:hypothetical protein